MDLLTKHHLAFLLFICCTTSAIGQTTYYDNLLTELDNDYQLTGGIFTVGGDEVLLDQGFFSNLTYDVSAVTGQPFERKAEITVTDPGPDLWSQQLFYFSDQDAAQGDVMLLTCWMRNAGTNPASFAVLYQEIQSPWQTSYYGVQQLPANGEWYRVFFPFTAVIDHPAGESIFLLHLGFEALDIEIAGVAVLNFQNQYTEADLPQQGVHYYTGIEPDASWRASAQQRIDEYRKADLTVNVTDQNGDPIEGATIEATLVDHAFGFGSADESRLLINAAPQYDFYREEFYRLFNYGTVGIYWSSAEQDSYAGSLINAQAMVDNGLRVRAHPILWGTGTPAQWSSLPTDVYNGIQAGNATYVQTRIDERIEDVTSNLNDWVTDYDVLNEPSHITALQDLLGQDEQVYWFEKTAEEAPGKKLFINDYNQVSFGGQPSQVQDYKQVIDTILSLGAPLDGVGFQGHMFDYPTPPERVYEVLEEIAALGMDHGKALELKVTEYDTQGLNDLLAADYLRDFLTMLFSHPQATSFTMWGFWDANHWLDDGPFYESDWTPKPALAVWENLVLDQWQTDTLLTSGVDGTGIVDGFKGAYEIVVTYNGETITDTLSLAADTTHTVTFITIPVEQPGEETTEATLYPSPAGQHQPVTVTVSGSSTPVDATLYNAAGQLVYDRNQPGKQFQLLISDLPKGWYFLKITLEKGAPLILRFSVM